MLRFLWYISFTLAPSSLHTLYTELSPIKMDNGCCYEQNSLVGELVRGVELARQLRIELGSTSSIERRELLVGRIISSFEKALLILKWSEPVQPAPTASASPGLPGSPISAPASPDNGGFEDLKAPLKKRKTAHVLTGKVRVSSDTGLEGPQEDGYSWRKYGQKDILGSKYPRSYYRCTFRNTRNCWAVKQVQRSDEDPSVFEITYRGKHACSHGSTPSSEEERQTTQTQQLQSQDQNNSWVNNSEPSALCFPTASIGFMDQHFSTPEPNCYLPSPCQSNNFGGIHNMLHSESDMAEIFSAGTSSANSPAPSLNFSVDFEQMEPSFAFDTLGFFS